VEVHSLHEQRIEQPHGLASRALAVNSGMPSPNGPSKGSSAALAARWTAVCRHSRGMGLRSASLEALAARSHGSDPCFGSS
jgi:hypothetical protein